MGEVIPFSRPQVHRHALAEHSEGLLDWADDLRIAQTHLRSAEEHGRHALQMLSEHLETLRWTVAFCNKCRAARALASTEEMIKVCDELSLEWHRMTQPRAARS